MFPMLIHPSSGACDLFVELFHGLYCSGSMCVGVTLWFGCGGVVSVCRLRHQCLSLHTDTTRPTSNQNNTTNEITQQISRKLLRMDVLTLVSHQCLSLHTDTTPTQPNDNVTPTHIETEQYNPRNSSTNKSQAPEDGCINNSASLVPQPAYGYHTTYIEPEQYNQ